MSIDANAITLSEHAMVSNQPLVTKVVFSLHEMMNVLQDVPLQTAQTLVMNGVRFVDNLPGVNWGPLNLAPTVTKGKPTPWQEQVYTVRNQFQIDKKLLKEKNLFVNPLDLQFEAWMEAFTYDFNNKFFNNSHDGSTGADANAPVGLRARIDNGSKYGVNSEMKINGGGVDMSDATMSATTSNRLIELIEQMLDYMNAPNGDGVVIYMNDQMKRRLNRALRMAGPGAGYESTKDAFDRPVPMFRGAKIRDVGRTVDQSTRIIADEATDGTPYVSGSKYTSIYAVRYGSKFFSGWQYDSLKPQNLGLDPTNGVMFNAVVDWSVGFWQAHTRAIARLYNIKMS